MARKKFTGDIMEDARKIKKSVDALVDESGRLGCGPPDWRPFVSELAELVERLATRLHEGA